MITCLCLVVDTEPVSSLDPLHLIGVTVLVVGIAISLVVLLAVSAVEGQSQGHADLVEAPVVEEVEKHPEAEERQHESRHTWNRQPNQAESHDESLNDHASDGVEEPL